MVDMFTEYEQSVSMTYLATLKLDASEDERKKAASAAKVRVGQAAHFIGQEAIQIHGGMGMTDEMAIGHYFKRLTIFDSEFGNVDHHMKRHVALA
jgi:alkylation response protein AidB-like acyl-CoA dehydrogenase